MKREKKIIIKVDKDTARTLLWIIEKARKPEGWLWNEKIGQVEYALRDGLE